MSEQLFSTGDLQAVMDRRHDLFRRAVLGGQEALLPAFRQANREYTELRARERQSPEWRQKQLPGNARPAI